MKKPILWSIPLIVVILAITGYLLFTRDKASNEVAEAPQPEEPQPTLGAALIFSEGAVEYKSGEADWTRATTEVSLQEGDSIEVVGEGKAIINIDDGSVVRLNSDSGITLTSLDPNHIVVTNEKGNVYTRVVKSDRVFEVATTESVYESLGTAYQTYNNDDKKGVKVYHNKVRVKDADGNEKVVVDEGKMYFDKNDEDEDLEEKVEDIPEIDIKDDKFLVWNATEDDKSFKDEMGKLAPALSSVTKIELTYSGDGNISWSAEGESPKGYKIVWSTNSNPEYPTRDGDKFEYLSDPEASSGSIDAFDGDGTYYIRVCEYLGGECGVYSNQVQATFDNEPDEPEDEPKDEPKDEPREETSKDVTSISLSHAGSGKMTWSVDGYSESGYKVVWSKNSGPTYPTRSGDKYIYKSSPDSRSATVTAFSGTGTYYVRACEYLGGKCGTYSNQVTVELQGKEEVKKEEPEAESSVTSISLSGSGNNVSWSAVGNAPNGYKVVWSKNTGPTYPLRDGDKYIFKSDPNASATTLNPFDGEGTYYVRVCEYLGGECGIYSNQITVEL
jgi:hypothetical protein